MDHKDWSRHFLKVLRKLAREKKKWSPEAHHHLCQFFRGLLMECLERAELKPEDLKTSEEELTALKEGKTWRRSRQPTPLEARAASGGSAAPTARRDLPLTGPTQAEPASP